ncbi:sensory rhodopsin transducer [Nitrosomonas communis]|uniref:sensory rhodopsin transducer n=1 Tax=Nitrosomonas communis TaxID=44574 RepID=UPI003D294F3D
MQAIGKKKWVIPAGRIPLQTTGKEPDFLSQDRIAILNTGMSTVKLKLTVYHPDQEPIENYILEIKGQRLRKIRINDLIDPFPVFLATDYALVIEAEHEVIIQFLRMNTGHRNVAIMGTMAYGTDG